MKFLFVIAAILAATFVPNASANELKATKGCLAGLAWQREGYFKAHVNVIQSLRNTQPNVVHWSKYRKQHGCLVGLKNARALRLEEVARWNKLRLQRPGVRWIIRKQFRAAGMDAVYRAYKVVSCESSFNPHAYNGADSGAWQINYVHHLPNYIMFSPELSTAWAWRASDHGTNFSPTWVCATRLGIS